MISALSRREWPWHLLHVAMAFGAPLVFFLMLGCLKAHTSKADLGPEIPSEKINQALAEAAKTGDLSKLKAGQYLEFVSTRHFTSSDADTALGQRRVEVVSGEDAGTRTKFTTRITNVTRQSDNHFQTVVGEETLYVNKSTSPEVRSFARTAVRTSFHHLREVDKVAQVPTRTAARPGCGGLSPCVLPVHNVRFDMVLWQDQSTYQKISFDLDFAKMTPFIPFGSGFDRLTGLVVNDCRSLDVGGAYVRDCTLLDDFQN